MVDVTCDLTNTEQMVICIHYVDSNLDVHEECTVLSQRHLCQSLPLCYTLKIAVFNVMTVLAACQSRT